MKSNLASMTGFGRARGVLSDRLSVSVVIRSVNHRYLDVVVRNPMREEIPEAEAAVRAAVTDQLQRGRVTVQLNLERTTAAGSRVLVNGEAVASVVDQLRALPLPGEVGSSIELRDVLAVPGLVILSEEPTVLGEEEIAALGTVAAQAVEQLVVMRRQEASRLGQQIKAELAEVRSFIAWIEPQLDELRERGLVRLKERIGELVTADPDRLVQEAAVQADRADVAEEVVRLNSHIGQFEERLGRAGSVGRALDFICQELNRELNTLAAKCRETGVSARLVDARTAVERIREQVQNLE